MVIVRAKILYIGSPGPIYRDSLKIYKRGDSWVCDIGTLLRWQCCCSCQFWDRMRMIRVTLCTVFLMTSLPVMLSQQYLLSPPTSQLRSITVRGITFCCNGSYPVLWKALSFWHWWGKTKVTKSSRTSLSLVGSRVPRPVGHLWWSGTLDEDPAPSQAQQPSVPRQQGALCQCCTWCCQWLDIVTAARWCGPHLQAWQGALLLWHVQEVGGTWSCPAFCYP